MNDSWNSLIWIGAALLLVMTLLLVLSREARRSLGLRWDQIQMVIQDLIEGLRRPTQDPSSDTEDGGLACWLQNEASSTEEVRFRSPILLVGEALENIGPLILHASQSETEEAGLLCADKFLRALCRTTLLTSDPGPASRIRHFDTGILIVDCFPGFQTAQRRFEFLVDGLSDGQVQARLASISISHARKLSPLEPGSFTNHFQIPVGERGDSAYRQAVKDVLIARGWVF